jgi:formamidopyrimidine-DNA glycosylase
MPELPEVETVARQVRPRLVGRSIERVHVHWARTVGGATPRAFARALEAARFTSVERRGKYILFELARGGAPAGFLVGHLRMTGRMLVEPAAARAPAYERVAFELDDGRRFSFVDVRKFGRLVHAARAEDVVGSLGPEPLGEDCSAQWFARALRSRARRVKPLLLDQSFVAGLGNIYVDESLHAARVHPLARADRLPQERAHALWSAMRATLNAAIEREGSSFDAFYRTPEGKPGSYQDAFRVYGRAGEACPSCGGPIRRIVVGQRGTHFCPRCQRAPRA